MPGRLGIKSQAGRKGKRAKAMRTDDLRKLLSDVRDGKLGVDGAVGKLSAAAIADLGFATVDLQRVTRCGFAEMIFCEGKTAAWVESVVQKLIESRQDCLATRVSE